MVIAGPRTILTIAASLPPTNKAGTALTLLSSTTSTPSPPMDTAKAVPENKDHVLSLEDIPMLEPWFTLVTTGRPNIVVTFLPTIFTGTNSTAKPSPPVTPPTSPAATAKTNFTHPIKSISQSISNTDPTAPSTPSTGTTPSNVTLTISPAGTAPMAASTACHGKKHSSQPNSMILPRLRRKNSSLT